jgi:hypothetical protein
MIAPIWEEFPEPRLPGHTSILLRLSDNYDPGELIAEIKSLDPRLLIFLRTLRQVNLMSFDGGRIWRSTLRRHDIPYGKDGENIVELWHNAEFSSLKITNFSVFGLPSNPKRPGSTQSEILLAFLLTQGNKPSIKSQNIYAFLPIRDYRFKVNTARMLLSKLLLTSSSSYFKLTFYLLRVAKILTLLQLGTRNCLILS